MPVRKITAHEKMKEDRGKIAFQRGPLVFCFEGVDNEGHVLDRVVEMEAPIQVEFRSDLLHGIHALLIQDQNGEPLTAVPYYAWSHRGVGEMAVWIKAEEL